MSLTKQRSQVQILTHISSRWIKDEAIQINAQRCVMLDKAVSGQHSEINNLSVNWHRTAEILFATKSRSDIADLFGEMKIDYALTFVE